MVSIERAIEDLRKAELVGEDIVTTEGEIIILLDALKDLRNATKRIVERLEKLAKYEESGDCPKDGMCNGGDCKHCHFKTAIEIVKAELN